MTARERLAPLAARLRAALADEKQRVNLLVCMGLAGLLLLAVSSWLPADSSTQSAAPAAMTDSTADYAAELETRLTALISRVEGAGKTAVMVTLDSGTEFFESARLTRSKARDEALDTLKKSLKDTKLTSEEKEQLTTQLSDRISNITLETKLETLIKSKGFTDCVVNLEGSKANVTVMTESDALTAEEVTRIRDALLSQCKGLTAQDITIVEVK